VIALADFSINIFRLGAKEKKKSTKKHP